ncbi:uncharacterized protein LOC135806597 isoform X2 [Sycon ciliatum]
MEGVHGSDGGGGGDGGGEGPTPARITCRAQQNGLDVQGERAFVVLGTRPTSDHHQSIIGSYSQKERPSMTLKSDGGAAVISGHGIFVWQPHLTNNLPEYQETESRMGTKHGKDATDYQETHMPRDPCDSSIHRQESSGSDEDPKLRIAPDNDMGMSGVPFVDSKSRASRGEVTYETSCSGIVVHGSGMMVVHGGNEQDLDLLDKIPIASDEYVDSVKHDMNFNTRKCNICVCGRQCKIFIGGQSDNGSKIADSKADSPVKRRCTQCCKSLPTCVSVEESVDSLGLHSRDIFSTPSSPVKTSPGGVTNCDWCQCQQRYAGDTKHSTARRRTSFDSGDRYSAASPEYVDINSMPVHKLSFSARLKLAELLNIEQINGHDWRLLADSFGYSYTYIRGLERKESPTLALLDALQGKGINVGQLLDVLAKLDRKDVVIELTEMLEDSQF